MMVNIATFPQWKLTYQKIKNRYIVLVIIIIIILIFIVSTVLFFSIDSCGLQHIEIIHDINLYTQNLDPNFCMDLLDKIYSFNDSCKPVMEIIDCG